MAQNSNESTTIKDLGNLAQTLNFTAPAYLLSKLRCCYCGKICIDVMEAKCKHLYCVECVEKVAGESKRCPMDNTLITNDEVIKNPDLEAKILKLTVYCPYQDNGCKVEKPLSTISQHIKQCEFAAIQCPQGCSARIRTSDLQNHLRFMCTFRHVPCQFCGKDFVMAFKQKHFQDCPRYPIECPNQCGVQDIPQEDLSEHFRVCTVTLHPCQYQHLGCKYQGHGIALRNHEEDILHHFKIMADGYSFLNLQFDVLMQETKGNILLLRNDNCALRETYKELMKQFERLQRFNENVSEKLTSLRVHVHKILQTQEAFVDKDKGSDSGSINSGEEENEAKIKKQLQTLSNEMIEAVQEDLLNKIKDQEERLQALAVNNFTGTLVWKITNYTRKKQESVARTKSFLFSEPFFTDRYGYQLCAKAFLGGDGEARGTHLSLYVIVMKGPWDDILTWPFRHKFVISLLDQRSTLHKSHISDHFSPNASSSFQKPNSVMNVGAGVMKFASHTDIEVGNVYLVNDTIYLKISVLTDHHKSKKHG